MSADLGSGLLLKLKFVVDRRLHYHLDSRVVQEVREGTRILSQEDRETLSAVEQRVLRVDPDGSGHLLVISTPRQDPPRPDLRQVTYHHLDPQGQVLESSLPNPGIFYCFPKEAVSPGGTWEGSSKSLVPGRPQPVWTPFRFWMTGRERRAGHECLVIEFESDQMEFDVPNADRLATQVTTHSRGRLYFAAEEGYMVRLEVKSMTRPKMGTTIFETHNTLAQELLESESPRG